MGCHLLVGLVVALVALQVAVEAGAVEGLVLLDGAVTMVLIRVVERGHLLLSRVVAETVGMSNATLLCRTLLDHRLRLKVVNLNA